MSGERVERLAYRVSEFAEAMGMSRSMAYQEIAAGRVKCFRLGSKSGKAGTIRITVEAAREYAAAQQAGQ